jgi:hypothetical protein
VWCVREFSLDIQQHGVCNFHVRSTWKVAGGADLCANNWRSAHKTRHYSQSAQCGRPSIKVAQFITLRAKVFPTPTAIAGLLELQKRRICVVILSLKRVNGGANNLGSREKCATAGVLKQVCV